MFKIYWKNNNEPYTVALCNTIAKDKKPFGTSTDQASTLSSSCATSLPVAQCLTE